MKEKSLPFPFCLTSEIKNQHHNDSCILISNEKRKYILTQVLFCTCCQIYWIYYTNAITQMLSCYIYALHVQLWMKERITIKFPVWRPVHFFYFVLQVSKEWYFVNLSQTYKDIIWKILKPELFTLIWDED